MEGALAQGASVLGQVLIGTSLAACAGLRAFLPLLAVGVAGKLELLPLAQSFKWLSSWPALIVFGVAVVVELLADKFPLVDHTLDMLHVAVKPIAGVILVTCVLTELSPLQSTVLGLILGGSVAASVHVAKSQVRLLSSVSTGGLANPLVSLLEDAGAVVGSVVSFVLPGLIVLLFLIGVLLLALALRRAARRGGERPAWNSGRHGPLSRDPRR